jgi:5-methylcytosine-specific restriction endonuclease McrA
VTEERRKCEKCLKKLPRSKFMVWRRTSPMPCGFCDKCRKPLPSQSTRDSLQVGGTRSRAKRMGIAGDFSTADWITILENSGGRCAHCGKRIGRKNLTIDHVIPMICGGLNVASNIVASCWPCNRKREPYSPRFSSAHARGVRKPDRPPKSPRPARAQKGTKR